MFHLPIFRPLSFVTIVGFVYALSSIAWASSELGTACRDGKVDQVKRLLQSDAAAVVSSADTHEDWDLGGHTGLHEAALAGHSDVLDALLNHRASVHWTDNHQQTALHWAAVGGHSLAARVLLAHDAQPDATDRQGRKPLHIAAFAGHLAVVNDLVRRRASLDALDEEGHSPAAWADMIGNHQVRDIIEAANRLAKGLPDVLPPPPPPPPEGEQLIPMQPMPAVSEWPSTVGEQGEHVVKPPTVSVPPRAAREIPVVHTVEEVKTIRRPSRKPQVDRNAAAASVNTSGVDGVVSSPGGIVAEDASGVGNRDRVIPEDRAARRARRARGGRDLDGSNPRQAPKHFDS